MKINDLRYVLTIAQAGSFNKAAKELYMKQPRLSKAIKDLEDELHCTLFLRSYKGVELSDKGKEFVIEAKKIIDAIDDLEKISINNTLTINIYTVRSEYIKKAFVKYINDMNSVDYNINYNEMNSLETIKAIDENNGDVGIIRYQDDYEYYYLDIFKNRNIHYKPIKEFQYYITLSKDHDIDIDKLDNYIEVYHKDERMSFPMLYVSYDHHPTIRVNEKQTQLQMIQDIKNTYMWCEELDDDYLDKHHLIQYKYNHVIIIKDIIIYREMNRQVKKLIEVITKSI